MAKTRKPIPATLKAELLYKAAHTCSVCKKRELPIQIHHIDQNPANNNEQNLIVLCLGCHDEAHTKHGLSINLSPALLKSHKATWQKEVAEKASYAMTAAGNDKNAFMDQAIWAFINHQRILHVMKAKGVKFDEDRFDLLKSRGVIDAHGIPLFQKKKSNSRQLVTIYDHFEYDDFHRLFGLYNDVVERLIIASQPIELGAIWTKTQVRELIKPGDLIYCIRGFHFRRGPIDNQEEDREVYARAGGVEVRFTANTRHMFGSSSLYDSFTGHRVIAAFLLVKNVADEDGNVVIRATPIAMGMGFSQYAYESPHPLKYGWATPKKRPRDVVDDEPEYLDDEE